ncbi:hypothetical protein I6E68_03495 [Salinibacterium sp. NSLL150]|uniref:hypothetical protein n=1 Tax=unclassified Salinibacterium TaxID=2632331 RepID=UPI0018CFC746|nr:MULTISPECIES: hypothetical protein [unclassified Salinibacterium]MBH0098201.1 hypothetical protein [Salinibacterium sp. NSLL35]MBH0100956.1 hypothetical protein [Salinibacterium sp. NSLL150]MBH0103715.1 hypothetical protein [Salinibacterium sp. NSLL16]MBH0106476.1 hypothetical protein [Salinibacterium sp. NSLL17]
MRQDATQSRRLELPQITGRGAHTLIWIYFVTMSALALLSLDDVRSPVPVYISIGLFATIWLVLTRDTQPRVGVGVSVYVIVASVAASALSSDNAITGGFSQWYVGAGAIAMFYLSLRRRDLLAWIGFAAIGATVILWGFTTDDRLLEAIVLVARQAPFVLVGSLFSLGMRRTSQRLDGIHGAETARAAAEAAALARTAERSRRLVALDSAVGAQLQRIADGVELTTAERDELLIAEARLRDSLRARQLDLPEIVAAVQRTRRRGISVVLLDDRYPHPLPPGTLPLITEAAVRILDSASIGAVTIRLLPAGRPLLATLVADDDEYSRIEIPAL